MLCTHAERRGAVLSCWAARGGGYCSGAGHSTDPAKTCTEQDGIHVCCPLQVLINVYDLLSPCCNGERACRALSRGGRATYGMQARPYAAHELRMQAGAGARRGGGGGTGMS